MIQSIVVIVFLLVGAGFVQANLPALHLPSVISVPGAPGFTPSRLRVLVTIGGVLVLVWLAGMADLRILRGRVYLLDEALVAKEQELAAKEQELLRVKSAAYDKQAPALADLRAQLEAMVLEVKGMVAARGARSAGAGPDAAA